MRSHVWGTWECVEKIRSQFTSVLSILFQKLNEISMNIENCENYRNRSLSCPHEGNMRYLHIPKLTVCFICKNPLSLQRSQCNFCSQNRKEVKMQLRSITSLPPGMNVIYVLCKELYVLCRK